LEDLQMGEDIFSAHESVLGLSALIGGLLQERHEEAKIFLADVKKHPDLYTRAYALITQKILTSCFRSLKGY
jgi:hypothetical protein